MSKLFISHESSDDVKKDYPWATFIEEVEGGHIIFETYEDWKTWKNQK